MAEKKQASEPKAVAEVAKAAKDAAVKRDQDAVEQWKEAAAEAPDAETTAEIWGRHQELMIEADRLRADYAQACVRRALVYGWIRIAEEQDLSAKQLHAWHKQFCPSLPDLSRIPEREMRREERRMADLQRRMESEKKLREQYNAAQKRLNEMKEGVQ